MKALRLPLLVLAASLGLAACEYHNATETHVIPPQASAPDDTTRLPATNTAAAPVTPASGASADATTAPAQPTANATAPDRNAATSANAASAGVPAPANSPAPDTNAMGAPATSVSAPAASDGTAAQTELGRFLEENASRKAS